MMEWLGAVCLGQSWCGFGRIEGEGCRAVLYDSGDDRCGIARCCPVPDPGLGHMESCEGCKDLLLFSCLSSW